MVKKMHAKFECKFVNYKSMLDVILVSMKINILIERRLRLVLYRVTVFCSFVVYSVHVSILLSLLLRRRLFVLKAVATAEGPSDLLFCTRLSY